MKIKIDDAAAHYHKNRRIESPIIAREVHEKTRAGEKAIITNDYSIDIISVELI